MYKVTGPTYSIRLFLQLAGCRWNKLYWVSPHNEKELKGSLKMKGLKDDVLRKLKVEEILKKEVDKE